MSGVATEGHPYKTFEIQVCSETFCRGGPPWPPHAYGQRSHGSARGIKFRIIE